MTVPRPQLIVSSREWWASVQRSIDDTERECVGPTLSLTSIVYL